MLWEVEPDCSWHCIASQILKILQLFYIFFIRNIHSLLSPVINAANSDTADSSYASEKVPVIEGAETIKILK